MTDAVSRFIRALPYCFRDSALLDAALTHRSARGPNNERLEFLGDAVLSAVIGEALYRRYPRASEGELSRLRASLVKGETLASLARELGLGEALTMGIGERKSGGFRRASILADALEAVFGAAFLDSDFDVCKVLILSVYQQRLEQLPAADSLKDPKTRLQEFLQQIRQPLPVYSVVEISGAEHARQFKVLCEVDGQHSVSASAIGSSRRQAEQQAAAQVLAQLIDDTVRAKSNSDPVIKPGEEAATRVSR